MLMEWFQITKFWVRRKTKRDVDVDVKGKAQHVKGDVGIDDKGSKLPTFGGNQKGLDVNVNAKGNM